MQVLMRAQLFETVCKLPCINLCIHVDARQSDTVICPNCVIKMGNA